MQDAGGQLRRARIVPLGLTLRYVYRSLEALPGGQFATTAATFHHGRGVLREIAGLGLHILDYSWRGVATSKATRTPPIGEHLPEVL
jgi:hypothetical protein